MLQHRPSASFRMLALTMNVHSVLTLTANAGRSSGWTLLIDSLDDCSGYNVAFNLVISRNIYVFVEEQCIVRPASHPYFLRAAT